MRVALKAIIEKKGKILVLKRSAEEEVYTSLWDIPGGKMEFGEQPVEALKREIMEETGLEVDIKKPFTVWSFMAKPDLQIVGVTLIAEYVSGEVKLSSEHTDFKWIEAKEFSSFEADKSLKKEIEKYSNSL
ncbi:MAG: NUDIX domain-containing protein [Lactobacillaceae bacterium]|nr:NUDIX domain-containing protein [Lactobacillaceae bacterium]